MRKILLTSFLFWCCAAAFSQDTLITNEGDTIACKITRVTDDFIHFSVFDKSGVLLMRSRLPLSSIQSYNQISSAAEATPEIAPIGDAKDDFVPDLERPPTFRLAINGGFSYQFGGYDHFPRSYTSQVQTLWNIGGDFFYYPFAKLYYPLAKLGFGFRYTYTSTGANEDFGTPPNIVTLRDEKIQFSSYGLSVLYRRELYSDNFLNYFIASEFIHYRTDFLFDGIAYYESGTTTGLTIGCQYDMMLSQRFGLGLGGSVTLATLSEINSNGSIFSTDFSISRVDLSVGLRLYK